MKVGYLTVWQNLGSVRSDAEAYRNELALADLVEGLGFDSLWTVEHHFSDYSMCPDPLTYLAYMAGRTERIQLGSGVVVLPWHDPVRVAGQIAQLDNLTGGRLILGIGRGLGRAEYEGFGVPMEEARERFDEAAELVLNALETGTIKHTGRFFNVPESSLRPEPLKSFVGRSFCAAVSPESVQTTARLGLPMLFFMQKPYDRVKADLEAYRETFVSLNGREPTPNTCALFVYCHEDPEVARQKASVHMGNYWTSTMAHYELLTGTHHATTKGYEAYSAIGKAVGRSGTDEAREAYVELQAYGTPDQVFEKIQWVRDNIHCDTVLGFFNYGGMDPADAERNMRLFASEVTPRLQALPPLGDGSTVVP